MPPTKTQRRSKPLGFGKIKNRPVVADFSGGSITSDAGLLLVSQVDECFGITQRFADCFEDHRHPSYVEHPLHQLIAQRVYGLVQGYEDLNDHDDLRQDPLFGVAVGQLESEHARCAPLAGKSTLNRLEQAPREPQSETVNRRYVKVNVDHQAIENLLVELFFDLTPKAPRQVILDLDVTDDLVHGEQELAAFNGYYAHECYAPLYIFCAHHLLAAKLRPSNVDPAAGALEELQRIIPKIQQHWPGVGILVRGDSAYARDEIMSWCEAQGGVDYVFGLAGNSRLERMTYDLEQMAQAKYEFYQQVDPSYQPGPWFRTVYYRTLDSWSRQRRVVCKMSYGSKGAHRHFVVTSIPASRVGPSKLHQDYYCPRGDMENRLKEQQLDLFSDRTSTHRFDGNQLRLWFSSLAYVLLQALRQHGLARTELAKAQVGTLRQRLLKVGAQICISVRRVHIALCSSYPLQKLFALVHRRLRVLADTS